MTSAAQQPDGSALTELLRDGTLEIVGRIVGSSNNAMLVNVHPPAEPADVAQAVVQAIYKPTRGERPLADFPDGTLGRREVAAYLVSEATGWGIVPVTLLRDGPFGEGMVQAVVEVDESVDLVEMVLADDPRLRRMATFDAIVNNTDRKGGHILPVDGGRTILGVDHGVCFSTTPKLRTVLWGWRDTPFETDELDGLARVRDALGGDLGRALRTLLSRAEVKATRKRVDALLASGRFPVPSETWPAIPWPPF